MGEELPDVRKLALDWHGRDRLVAIQKAVNLPAVVRVVGDSAKPVVFRDFGEIVLTEILP
jgi:hypothetical protein